MDFSIFLPAQRLVNPFQRRRGGSIHAFPASQAASSKWLCSILLIFLRTWLVWSGDPSKKIERWNVTKIVSRCTLNLLISFKIVSTDMLDPFAGCYSTRRWFSWCSNLSIYHGWLRRFWPWHFECAYPTFTNLAQPDPFSHGGGHLL